MAYANNKAADQPAHPRSLIPFGVLPREHNTYSYYIRTSRL